MKLRNVVMLVALVLMLALVGVVQAQDVPVTDEPTAVVFATNTLEAVTVEAVPTEVVVIVEPVEPTAIPGDGAGQDEPETTTFLQDTMQTLIIAFTALLGLVLVLVAGVLVKVIPDILKYLYNSQPLIAGTVKQAALDATGEYVKFVERQREAAAGNAVNWDDPLWDQLYQQAKADRERIAAVGPGGESPAL